MLGFDWVASTMHALVVWLEEEAPTWPGYFEQQKRSQLRAKSAKLAQLGTLCL